MVTMLSGVCAVRVLFRVDYIYFHCRNAAISEGNSREAGSEQTSAGCVQ